MSLTFTHTFYRDNGHPELRDEVELTVTATVYMGDVDDVSWTPEIELTAAEQDELREAAEDELAEARECARVERIQMRAIERELDRVGY